MEIYVIIINIINLKIELKLIMKYIKKMKYLLKERLNLHLIMVDYQDL